MNACKNCFRDEGDVNESGSCTECRSIIEGVAISPPNASEGIKRGVRSPYTEEMLSDMLKAWNDSGASLRKIASSCFGGHVSHSVIQKCMQGEFPKSDNLRAALGLPILVQVTCRNGYIEKGAESLGSMKCFSDHCNVHFIPNNPNRKYCFNCSPPS